MGEGWGLSFRICFGGKFGVRPLASGIGLGVRFRVGVRVGVKVRIGIEFRGVGLGLWVTRRKDRIRVHF